MSMPAAPAQVPGPRRPSTAGRILTAVLAVLLGVGAWTAYRAATNPAAQAAVPPVGDTSSTALTAATLTAQTGQASWWAGHHSWTGYTPAPTAGVRIITAHTPDGELLDAAAVTTGAPTCKRWTVHAGIPTAPVDTPADGCTPQALSAAVDGG